MRHEHGNHPQYRPDIDGMRAVAVLAVVGFHAFPQLVRGGFIGVDIFFVISGFLISSILFKGLEQGSFSIAEFYKRRVKRIFPALIVVLASSLAAGWFILMADEYRQLGKHVVAGAGFLSNIALLRESGYFDSAAERKPLLHLWSLGIEEQFYLVWPLWLWICWKTRLGLFTGTAGLCLLSFAWNAWLTDRNEVAAFYLPFTRFWELQAGAILAGAAKLNGGGRIRGAEGGAGTFGKRGFLKRAFFSGDVRSLAGVALLACGFSLISKDASFPGWWALFPVLGAFLVISAPGAWVNRRILSARLFVWIGLVSYPLYLWHWPLLSYAQIVAGQTPPLSLRLAAVAMAALLALATYLFIEKPLRYGQREKRNVLALVLFMLACAGMGLAVYKNDGFGFRLKDRQAYADFFENSLPRQQYFQKMGIAEAFRMECEFYDLPAHRAGKATQVPVDHIDPSCYKRDKAYPKSVMIWGDSHAEHLNFGLRNHLPPTWQILQVASSGCALDVTVERPSRTDYCAQSNWFAKQTVMEARPDVVILSQSTRSSAAHFKEMAKDLRKMGVQKVLIVGDSPRWRSDLPKIILKRLWISTPRRTFSGLDKDFLGYNRELKRQFTERDNADGIY